MRPVSTREVLIVLQVLSLSLSLSVCLSVYLSVPVSVSVSVCLSVSICLSVSVSLFLSLFLSLSLSLSLSESQSLPRTSAQSLPLVAYAASLLLLPYMGTSLIRNRRPLGPYSSPMVVLRGGRFLMSEVTLHAESLLLSTYAERVSFCEALGHLGQDEPASG